ncbi:trifunctional transcriptional activator/DNA repair protein Ada/methylated-DNA--[protein]-cysteine S-methyltransferase [Ciceribacter sp. L1K22]|uniref:bifunctional transcriptional activator/DNA repair enzyme AdaA n=1 Tax=Ciceribacter sp. L1K22 TaxID=2820275 RepID=UPI001ABDF090|nr:trifunctional transcriptional activator/DNA repair protein Ada/methylated-DNA--[protein]-cysteine S-methyltransferase [Ciceribacter sp. L1K22]MBO3759615.1 bifunctional transcriptional activator/DNA repair protein Ada [Ciceribacter sp. L1K22]
MLLERPSDDVYYDALIRRDAAYDGFAYVCVTSTGIFCRFTCPARKPKKENCVFRETTAECLDAGFRACKRCRPMLRMKGNEPTVAQLLDALDREPQRRWRESDIEALGLDLSTVRRAFKRQFGMSFLEIARQRRVGLAVESLVTGSDVIEAQLDAGFESGSGFRAAITQLFGEAPQSLRGKTLLKADWIETPIGPMMAIACDHALHLLEFIDRPALPAEIRRLQKTNGCGIVMGRTTVTDRIESELRRYFDGYNDGFSTPLAGHGTPFERMVWDELRRIPAGTVRSYSEQANAIGRTSAVRAVARANGANQIAIVVPCHRVLGVNGLLTGYGGGLWRKRWLLEHEKRMVASLTPMTELQERRA